MTGSPETAKIRQILETALDASLNGIANPAREQVENWDSLTHMEIIFMLEDEFGVRFSEDEIGRLNSEAEIAELVREKQAA
ncbi:MAG TPA: acyl carrier protein [Solirubrobacteraceae bacterium]|nr:acyl carrier protein [Solirubrobacteraceae bacterium]